MNSFRSDDTVEVGANLYEVDTDAETSFEASTSSLAPISNSSAPPSLEPAGKKESIEAKSYSAESAHRSPLIKFLGKEGWEAARRGSSPTPALSVTPTISISLQSPHAVTKISHNAIIHPMYGRPRFTAAEMEALLTGGATTAPTVLLHSSGATFKQ